MTPGLHLIGEGDIVGPDVKLPLPEPQHPTVHPAAVDAHTHVHIHAGHLSYQSAKKKIGVISNFFQTFSVKRVNGIQSYNI